MSGLVYPVFKSLEFATHEKLVEFLNRSSINVRIINISKHNYNSNYVLIYQEK